ncbi:MAG: RagB/SusD family nutrient uptake outer membrane protein [Bacteroidales bacterium]
MRTKIFYIIITIGLVSFLNSCTDYLEIEPTDRQTTENFYKTRDDAFSALMGIYKPLTYQGWANWQDLGATLDIMSDDCHKGGGNFADGGGWGPISIFKATPSASQCADLWKKAYDGISRANLLLNKFDEITFSTKEVIDAKNFKAEALFLRAHYHLEAVRLFENIPLLIEPVDANSWRDVKQTDVHATYSQIAKDMLDAIPDLAVEFNDANKAVFVVDDGLSSVVPGLAAFKLIDMANAIIEVITEVFIF